LRDEAARGEFVDQRPVHLLVEIEIEGIERAFGVAEAGLLVPALEETILATQKLVGHEHRDQIDRRDLLGLSVAQACFEDGRHTGQPQLAERAIELDEIHTGSPVLRSMRSR
jgi:hypothetical protein